MSQSAEKTEFDYTELDEFIDGISQNAGALIPALHKAQHLFGYLPVEVQQHIARKLDIPASKVYGVVTFYSYFTMKKRGKYRVSVCMGTACFVRGADVILREFEKELSMKTNETTEDGLFTLDAVRCVGACGLAPLAVVNEKVYGRIGVEDVRKICKEYMEKGSE